MRKLALIAFSAALLAAWGSPVSAQSVDLDASLTAMCGTDDCSTLKFLLELDGTSTVDYLELLSHSSTWQFGQLVAVLDSHGEEIEVSWISGSHPNQFSLYFMADASPEPITLLVDMLEWGSSDALGDGSLTYLGQGFDEGGHLAAFKGTVVPEPPTWLLLLIALAGLGAWVARRRTAEAMAQT